MGVADQIKGFQGNSRNQSEFADHDMNCLSVCIVYAEL